MIGFCRGEIQDDGVGYNMAALHQCSWKTLPLHTHLFDTALQASVIKTPLPILAGIRFAAPLAHL